MITYRTLGIACILFSLLLHTPHIVQSQDLDVIGIHYDVRNGLLDNQTAGGLVDDIGGLWLATFRGLSNFDGHRFINFTSQDSIYRISSNKVRAISYSNEHVYVAADSTVDKINVRSKVVESLPYVHKNGLIRHLINGKDGKIYILVESGDLIEIESGKSLNTGVGALDYFHVFVGDSNTILLTNAKSTFVARINLTTLTVEKFWPKERVQRARSVGLVLSETHGLMNMLNTGASTIDVETGEETVIDINLDMITSYNRELSNYEIFVSQYNKIQLRDRTGTVIPIRFLNSEQNYFHKILTDRKRTVFALHDRGFTVFRVPPNFFKKLPTDRLDNFETTVLYKSMLEQPDKKILLFTYKGVAEYEPNTDRIRLVVPGTDNYVTGVVADRSLYVASDGVGLLEYDSKTFAYKRRHAIDSSATFERAYSILKESDDELIIGYGMPFGVWRFFTKSGRFESIPIEFKQADTMFEGVNDIIKDDNGHYWVSSNRGLYHFDNDWNTIRVYSNLGTDPLQKISSSKINQVFIDSDKRLWVATQNGLYTKNDGEDQLVEVAPFVGNVIASIEEDQYRRLWVATYLGLALYDPKTEEVNRFYQEDGFADNEYNVGSHLKSSDNLLYFGGLNGVTMVNPSKWVLDDVRLSLQLTNILIEGAEGTKLVDFKTTLDAPIHVSGYSDVLTVQVSFMDYVNPTYSKYRYRLSGLNEQWTSFDNGTLRLRNLPVGEYFIEIVGANASGSIYDKPIRIPVVVTQPFYRSVYFPILIVIVVVSTIIVILYMNYSHKIALRTIKATLLNDIQDELGGILAKAAMKTELINPAESVRGDDLNEIQQLFREGIQSLRNLLWSLSSEMSSTIEFQDRMTEWLDFVFRGSDFEFSFQNKVPKMHFNLSIQQRRQLMPIIRELALNAIKHSSGSHFQVTLDKHKNKFRLTVYDNGQNMDGDISTYGYGLKGIVDRVETLGGAVSFEKNVDGFRTIILF